MNLDLGGVERITPESVSVDDMTIERNSTYTAHFKPIQWYFTVVFAEQSLQYTRTIVS
jgi:hypothetical protein